MDVLGDFTMGDNYKTCDMHRKAFPANMIDTDEHEMTKLYLERQQTIEGKKVKLALFVGKSEGEGADSCIACITDLVIEAIKATGKSVSWKNVTWVSETLTKKDGSGTYQRNSPVVKTVEEITADIQAEKAKAKVPVTPKTS